MISDYLPVEIKNFNQKFPLVIHPSDEETNNNKVEQTLFIAPHLSNELEFSREWQSLRYQLYLKLNNISTTKVEVAHSNLQAPIGKLPYLLNTKGEAEIFDELDNSLKFGKNLNLDDKSLLYLIEGKIGYGLDYFIVTDGYSSILQNQWFSDSVFPLNYTLSKQYQLDTLKRIGEKLNNLSHEDILTDIEQILTLINEKLGEGEELALSTDKSFGSELDITLYSIIYLINQLFDNDHNLVKTVTRFDNLNKFYKKLSEKVDN